MKRGLLFPELKVRNINLEILRTIYLQIVFYWVVTPYKVVGISKVHAASIFM
jgi:hypothetical protein